jgi:two-component system cell cycle sensor histidine kinase/response regulator CckA
MPRERVLALADDVGLIGSIAISEAVRDADGRIVDFRLNAVNNTAAEGMQPFVPDAVGLLWSDIIAPEVLERRLPVYARLIIEGGSREEPGVSVETRGGKAFGMDLRAAAHGEFLVTSWRDATDRLDALRGRRTAEERLRRLLSATTEGVLIVDSDGVNFANDAAATIFGLSTQELIAGAAALGPLVTTERRPLTEHMPARYESRIARADGRDVVLLVSEVPLIAADGRADASIMLLTDITESTLAEEELDRIFTLSEDLISIVGFDGTIHRVNPAYESVLGWTEKELRAMSYPELLHPEDLTLTTPASLLADGEVGIPTMRLRRRDGSYVWVDYRGVGIPERQMIYGIARDITDRIHAERERVELEAELRNSQKMEAIGRLAGGVAHDFNNILTAMGGYAEFVIAGVAADDPVRADAEEIRNEVQRATALTRQLTSIARRRSVEPRTIDLNDVVGGMERVVGRLLGAETSLETVLARHPVLLEADRSQLEQVVLNLALNVREAIPDRGTVLLATTRSENAAVLTVGVADPGVPLSRSNASAVPAGLGLATVMGIVDQCNGRIVVESYADRGAAYRVSFPLVDDSALT